MFSKSRSWIGGAASRAPRAFHSLEQLKYLHNVLAKNTTVTEGNRNLLVETIRSISEILIWGDQNDSTVFDFFLEKNMFAFFLNILRQKSGRYVCVQLLQTLNILFENISHETSLYYLLSNNHVNSIIVHKFDFSDEEIMAYYISFLKTLSLKLNSHTVHFFYNEHTNDFALYTEAIKFFNHPESMVRIAVRTLTLNVYKVENDGMLHYIRDKTAAPYFSNLVWFIGSHVIEMDRCVTSDKEHKNRGRLSDLVAEHLDHLHYLNDILIIDCGFLNDVLTDHLLNRLFLPLYTYSLVTWDPHQLDWPKISPKVSLYLLSQVFLIIHHGPLVNSLGAVILNGDISVFNCEPSPAHTHATLSPGVRRFTQPTEPLEKSLEMSRGHIRKVPSKRPNYKNIGEDEDVEGDAEKSACAEAESVGAGLEGHPRSQEPVSDVEEIEMKVMERGGHAQSSPSHITRLNTTDEEKSAAASRHQAPTSRPFIDAIFSALECEEDDSTALFALCLLYALRHNKGMDPVILDSIQMPLGDGGATQDYSHLLVERIIVILNKAAMPDSRIRLATLELACLLLKQLVSTGAHCTLKDVHRACIEGARQESVALLRNFYKGEEIFLDLFEDECRSLNAKALNVEYLTMDASILLPPTGTPLTGIEFTKRLPCGDAERARRAMRVFLMLRSLSLALRSEPEMQLPLTRAEDLIKAEDVLDLNNSDLLSCVVSERDSGRVRRFLVVDVYQVLLVEPDEKRLGWGAVRFAGLLQDLQVTGDKEDHRSLHVTIHKPGSPAHARPLPLLQATFQFDDHIRCMAAKQRLAKGRLRARHIKMQRIAALLELPVQPSPEGSGNLGFRGTGSQGLPFRFYEASRRASSDHANPRSSFTSTDRVPGFAVARQQSSGASSQDSPASSSVQGSTHGLPHRLGGVLEGSPPPPQRHRSVDRAGADSGTHSRRQSGGSSSSGCSAGFTAAAGNAGTARVQETPLASDGDSEQPETSGAAPAPASEDDFALPPSLTLSQQPTLSLLMDDSSDGLSVESLTLLPPTDPQCIHSLSQAGAAHHPEPSSPLL
ncbi:protein CLEC16A isoform X2 [Lampetra planeri]